MFQPKYAAYLNLIEPWWKMLRSLALKGRRFETWAEVCQAVARGHRLLERPSASLRLGRAAATRRAARRPGIALTKGRLNLGDAPLRDAEREVGGTAPFVSVLVPAYNAAPFLRRALVSALNQTMCDLEIVVVDDASTDETLAVGRSVAAEDTRVRVLANERNLGEARTHNRAPEAARVT